MCYFLGVNGGTSLDSATLVSGLVTDICLIPEQYIVEVVL